MNDVGRLKIRTGFLLPKSDEPTRENDVDRCNRVAKVNPTLRGSFFYEVFLKPDVRLCKIFRVLMYVSKVHKVIEGSQGS